MLKQAIRKPVSNLNQILRGLNSADQNDLMNFMSANLLSSAPKEIPVHHHPSGRTSRTLPQLKLISDYDLESETNDAWGRPESTAEQQVQQLLQHVERQQQDLKRCDLDLQRRRSELQVEIEQWRLEKEHQAIEIERRQTAILHQQQQIEQQQAQLVKLQQGLVDTQTGLRRVIERIVENCDPESLKREIQELRFELNESFERNFSRWEALRRTM